MPHTTHAYPFESKIFRFAEHLSSRITGDPSNVGRKFVMVLSSDGAVQTLHFTCPADSWRQFMDEMDEGGTPYLFYDPFDAPEYAWLSWRQVERSTMERLIGESFQDRDFKKDPVALRAGDLDPPDFKSVLR